LKVKGLDFRAIRFLNNGYPNKGKTDVDLDNLCNQIKEKYQHLGSVEE